MRSSRNRAAGKFRVAASSMIHAEDGVAGEPPVRTDELIDIALVDSAMVDRVR